ncbi:MAG: DUF1648 domain-containing protein [candidate division Zixibacteria bacterium]|nr:DUF1648 domain-containing protein [candidate division Zixibacteria bacterium]
MNRLLKILWPLSVATLVIQAIYYHPLLSERIASHFDLKGNPDGWSSKESFFVLWYLMIVFLNVWVPLVGVLVRKLPPSMVNIPHREYWLATEGRKAHVRDVVFVMMAGIFTGVNVILAMVFHQLARFNLGQSPRADGNIIWVILPVVMAFAIAYPLVAFRVKEEDGEGYPGQKRDPVRRKRDV